MKKERGITLVALVVTIIILLILAGVTFTQILGNKGLFSKVTQAVQEYKNAQDQETEILTKVENNLLELEKENNMPNIGDTVNYTYDKAKEYILDGKISGYGTYENMSEPMTNPQEQKIIQENLEWKVLNINNDGSIDLISKKPTNATLILGGALGYNNGVYILDDVCEKLYSNEKLKVKARNMKIEDFEKCLSELGKKEKENFVLENTGIKYNEQKIYYEPYNNYPKLSEQELGISMNNKSLSIGINISDKGNNIPTIETIGTTDSNGLTVSQTWYAFENDEKFFKSKEICETIFNTNDIYLLSSRCVAAYDTVAQFSIFIIGNNGMGGINVFNSAKSAITEKPCYLRPVINLNNSIKYKKKDDGSWDIIIE